MRIVISDSSCLIDLRKASLLGVFLRLPFEILIPNKALSHLAADPAVRLPKRELAAYIKRYGGSK